MASFGRSRDSLPYAPPPSTSPSAPSLQPGHSRNGDLYGSYPASYGYRLEHLPPSQVMPAANPAGYRYNNYYYGQPVFPPGTEREVARAFQAVDRDRSGFIDEEELRHALFSSGYQRFDVRTIRLLMFLFRNPGDPLRVGLVEFAALWSCLKQWKDMFDRFDQDRSGKIDQAELRNALYSLGYALPHSVLDVLISRYNDGSGRRIELDFDNFVECGMIVKGLTEKFKEKDTQYTGSATFSYDTFLSMIIPFLVS